MCELNVLSGNWWFLDTIQMGREVLASRIVSYYWYNRKYNRTNMCVYGRINDTQSVCVSVTLFDGFSVFGRQNANRRRRSQKSNTVRSVALFFIYFLTVKDVKYHAICTRPTASRVKSFVFSKKLYGFVNVFFMFVVRTDTSDPSVRVSSVRFLHKN